MAENSTHAWVQNHIAAFLAGGLESVEAERVEQHRLECPACAQAIDSTREFDRQLGRLFAADAPGPALEDRLIQSMRATPSIRATNIRRLGWKHKLLIGTAACFGIGLAGAGVTLLGDGGLSFPGSDVSAASPMSKAMFDSSSSMVPRDRTERESTRSKKSLNDGISNSIQVTPNAKSVLSREPGLGVRANDEMRSKLALRTPAELADWGKTHAGRGFVNGSFGASPDFGLDPNLPTNYNIDRIENTTVPGPIKPDEAVGNNLDSTKLPLDGYYKYSPALFGYEASKGDGGNGRKSGDRNVYFIPTEHKPKFTEARDPGRSIQDRKDFDRPVLALPASPGATPALNPQPPAPPAEAAAPRKIIIRTGEVEFEVESFDSAVATVMKLVNPIKGGFIATVNSEKLVNGKVKGSMVVRVPPESLDALVLDLRKELGLRGELKGQRIGSQDITKQYTDLESRLKAARTMEQRLLQIIKDGKGEIKQLLEAERELGVWRTKIEEFEGELRYFGNQVSLSTLTITMAEKEIKSAAGITENERVQTGIEAEDVDQAFQQLLAAVAEAKGRVTKSEMKQPGAGQFNATVNFEVAPEQAGPMRDRVRQLGRMARLEIDRVQQAEGGTPPKDAKVKRGDTHFLVQIYNVVTVPPRETETLEIASSDVPSGYRALLEAVSKAKGRVLAAKLDENDRLTGSGTLDFEVRRADIGSIQAALGGVGEIVSRNTNRAAESEAVTDAKIAFRVKVTNASQVRPRETSTVGVEVADVDATLTLLAALASESKGRIVDSNIAHLPSGSVTARVIYSVPLSAAPAFIERVRSSGKMRAQQHSRDPNAPEGKFALARIDVTLGNPEPIVARDDGMMQQVRTGLAYSAKILLVSLSWLIVGLCVVLPWGLVGYAGYRVVRRLGRGDAAPPAPPATPTAAPAPPVVPTPPTT